jgi:hypothetical protein
MFEERNMILSTVDETSYQLDQLVETLLEKTKTGKLDWRPTAVENTYVAAVRGIKTYTLQTEEADDSQRRVRIVVKDTWGNVELDFTRKIIDGSPVMALLEAAAQVASRMEERIHRSLELLNSL